MESNKIIYLASFLIIMGYLPLKSQIITTEKNEREIAIHNAISDFSSNCKLFETDSVFRVNFNDSVFHEAILVSVDKKEYTHKWKRGALYNGVISVSISRFSDYQYFYTDEEENILPTRHTIIDNKLFYWWDDDYPLSDEMIAVLWKYNLLQTELIIPEFSTNDSQKGAHYYFCKNDLSKYKRKITNIGLGYYEPPKIKCSKK